MIPLKKCEQILEKNGKKYKEEEIKKIREILYQLAEIELKIQQS